MTTPQLLVLLRDTSAIVARYQHARSHADECRAGWPTTCIGAAPDTTPTTTTTDTDERPGAGIPHDKADRAYRDMQRLLNEISGPIAQLAQLVNTWTPERHWTTTLNPPPTPELQAIDNGIWCANHIRYGHFRDRDTTNRRLMCRWCDGINRNHGAAPDRELIERHDRMGRITSADLDAFRLRVGVKGKKRKKGAA